MALEIARLTSKGQITLPQRLRDALGVKPGDALALTLTRDGVLINAAELSRAQEGEAALIQLVREIGAQLEAQGITDEEQLDESIKQTKREAYKLLYGPNTS